MYEPKSESLKLIAIKTKTKVYISDNVNNDNYFRTKLEGFIFEGLELKKSYRNNWYMVDDIPTKIYKVKPKKRVNKRYELKVGFPESELTPKIIPYEEFDESYEDVSGLYTYKYDEVDEGLEEVEFEMNIIEEIDDVFELTEVKYNLKHNFVDTLNTHPVLLPSKPCSLSKQDSYNIIRAYVKKNINSEYATITSDYDFCFTVKKRISHVPTSYQVNVNAGYSRRKPKYETRFNRFREETVYEVAPAPYQNYTVVTEFSGKDYDDLQKNIEEYLKELIEKINAPLIECECCKGYGVITDGNN